MKTETIEDASIRLVPNRTLKTAFGTPYEITPNRERSTFIKGVKWQQERSYYEEDLILYSDYVADCRLLETYPILSPKEWIEQIKNQ